MFDVSIENTILFSLSPGIKLVLIDVVVDLCFLSLSINNVIMVKQFVNRQDSKTNKPIQCDMLRFYEPFVFLKYCLLFSNNRLFKNLIFKFPKKVK